MHGGRLRAAVDRGQPSVHRGIHACRGAGHHASSLTWIGLLTGRLQLGANACLRGHLDLPLLLRAGAARRLFSALSLSTLVVVHMMVDVAMNHTPRGLRCRRLHALQVHGRLIEGLKLHVLHAARSLAGKKQLCLELRLLLFSVVEAALALFQPIFLHLLQRLALLHLLLHDQLQHLCVPLLAHAGLVLFPLQPLLQLFHLLLSALLLLILGLLHLRLLLGLCSLLLFLPLFVKLLLLLDLLHPLGLLGLHVSKDLLLLSLGEVIHLLSFGALEPAVLHGASIGLAANRRRCWCCRCRRFRCSRSSRCQLR
mmetsp:Transcript_34109/g.72585  ORF Transcript_34109/g.72585 Transcript_34109/m.72585 type:complete len:311 (+) Transcript_34109:364-1296(+)